MDKFVDRKSELNELNRLLPTEHSQFLIVYGRRRVGKTTLLLHWAQQTGLPFIYNVSRRTSPEACRRDLAQAIWNWAYPEVEAPAFSGWDALFRQIAKLMGDQQVILIWDEFPYAVEADKSLPSYLQAAWDHQFKDKHVTLILAGSHIGMMVDQMQYNAPLYGRFSGQLPIDAMPFGALQDFFPTYGPDERVAVYATLGGVPAYLERFNQQLDFSANVRSQLFQKTGMFRSEPIVLLSDLVRDAKPYESILRAIASGKHTASEIGLESDIGVNNLSPYLKRLQEMRFIERRIPATTPPQHRDTTTKARYHLHDPYLRFYYRFIEPNLKMIEQELVVTLWDEISEQFRAFVGATAFEDLCREWVLAQARARRLPFSPEFVGSHWASDSQVDVVAINWRQKAILLGECKWGTDAVGRSVITELHEKASLVIPGDDWTVYYAFFARAGFTPAARAEAETLNAVLVDLGRLDQDLREAIEHP